MALAVVGFALHRGLSALPAQWLGRVSYSWYLWHWPMMLSSISRAVSARSSLPSASSADPLCGGDGCPVVVGGQYVYADNGHLTPEYTRRRHLPAVRALLAELAPPDDGPTS